MSAWCYGFHLTPTPATARIGSRTYCDDCAALDRIPLDRSRHRFDPDAPHALLPIDPSTCPACGGPLGAETSAQDALFRHGGFGATLRTTAQSCRCGWRREPTTAEERPPREAP